MRLPLLAVVYGIFLAYIMVDNMTDGIRDRERIATMLVGVTSSAVRLLLFIGYWIQELVRPLGFGALLLLICSMSWTAVHTWQQLPSTDLQELSAEENRGHRAIVVCLVAVIAFPAYWFGGIAAFNAI
jgi:hypothetical protein